MFLGLYYGHGGIKVKQSLAFIIYINMVLKRLEEIRKVRLEKVKKLRKLGINPYPSKVKGVWILVSDARKKLGKKVGTVGRVWGWRTHGNSIFADLKDASGKIQLFFQKKNLGKNFDNLDLFDLGDFIWVTGRVFKTQAGELTVDVVDYQMLTKSVRPLPSTWHGLKDIEERYRQRYIDFLLNEEVKQVFEKKSQIISYLRKYLEDKGFVEMITPALQPVYGGATAKPFITHHNSLDIDLYLRISDELYLKRLIVGGFDKVYEICTDFRNEGIDRWHNPEFTMLEFYWAYADYEELMKMTEVMLASIVKEVTGAYTVLYGDTKVDFKPPWKRVTFRETLLEKTGIDMDKENTFAKLKKVIQDKKVNIDLRDAFDTPGILDTLHKTLIRTKIVNPTFLIDHPYSMRPLAKRHHNEESYVESFQLVAAGAELINAYSELNDPQDQIARWEEDMKREKEGVKEYQVIDDDYIRALEYGMPPTAGWGLGIDRFTAILTNQHSIKDTILYPTLRPEK
jgi:lysyl-tRNA synthetase class 2